MKGARVAVVPSPFAAMAERFAARSVKARAEAKAARSAAFVARGEAVLADARGLVETAAERRRFEAHREAEAAALAREAQAWNTAALEVWDVLDNAGGC